MTWNKFKKASILHSYAINIDRYFPRVIRSSLRKLSALMAALSFFASFSSMPFYISYTDGLVFIFAFFYLVLSFLEFFYNSMKNEGIKYRVRENIFIDNYHVEYALSNLINSVDEIDVTRSVFESTIGLSVLDRSGIGREEMHNFLNGTRMPIIASSLKFSSEDFSLVNFVEALYDTDNSLSSFLSSRSVNKEEFLGATIWVSKLVEKKRMEERFWSRDNLGGIPSIGTSWSYGNVSDIGKFGISMDRGSMLSGIDIDNGFRSKEVDLLENILDRREGANALIIDDDESSARDIVLRLLKRINLGIALPSLEHKNVVELDTISLIATFKNKGELESEIVKIFKEAMYAGNIILYIKDLSGFVASGRSIGVNVPSMFKEFLSSSLVHIIAHTTNPDFHFFIESNSGLLQSFERVVPDKLGVEASLPAIMEKAILLERDYRVVFTFASVRSLSESAERYITYGEMPEKALNLLEDIVRFSISKDSNVIKENDVLEFISQKTGVSVGPVKEEEADKIINLEEILHRRLIGQNEAVSAISSSIRRSRAGVLSPKRPIASFIFLGPTGVGKTEASKALAESFFGDENRMVRFDMSEYNDATAMQRLIGNFTENKTGLLSSHIRDNPYGVLLLDEFEKASRDVLDLFLQILDEGFFTDALGSKVNCKNLIIIATSNAGSSYIWEIIKRGGDLIKEKDTVIDKIISEKIYRPELINRFDAVVLFHPLKNEELKKIAELELHKLQERLKEQSYDFVISEPIISFLVEKGSDPEFGARSINRAIKTEVEDLIAKRILSGEVKPGGKIELNF